MVGIPETFRRMLGVECLSSTARVGMFGGPVPVSRRFWQECIRCGLKGPFSPGIYLILAIKSLEDLDYESPCS